MRGHRGAPGRSTCFQSRKWGQIGEERMDKASLIRFRDLLAAGDPCGEVFEAWAGKEAVRRTYGLESEDAEVWFDETIVAAKTSPVAEVRRCEPRRQISLLFVGVMSNRWRDGLWLQDRNDSPTPHVNDPAVNALPTGSGRGSPLTIVPPMQGNSTPSAETLIRVPIDRSHAAITSSGTSQKSAMFSHTALASITQMTDPSNAENVVLPSPPAYAVGSAGSPAKGSMARRFVPEPYKSTKSSNSFAFPLNAASSV